jgi:hypothetical protein
MKYLRTAANTFLLAFAIAGLSGCGTNGVVHAEKHVTNASKVSAVDVLYVERNLLSPSAAGAPVDRTITKFGYFEIGPKLGEFGPTLLRANGLSGTFRHMPAADLVAGSLPASKASSPMLVLEFRQGRVLTQGTVQSLTMMLNATLYDAAGKSRIWSAQFASHLGDDPALGIMKSTKVNQAYVEGLLAMVLDQLARDELLVLSNGKVVQPGAQKL